MLRSEKVVVNTGLLLFALAAALEGLSGFGHRPGSTEAAYIDWLAISDAANAVVDDVRRTRKHPLVPARIPVYGYIYDVKTGRLAEVPAATQAGRATAVARELQPAAG